MKQSKYLSLILRHHPEKGGITVDRFGWATIIGVLKSINDNVGPFTVNDLRGIVEGGTKTRFMFDKTENLIKAIQGHSFPVDLELSPSTPPLILYHGTKDNVLESIVENGILPMGREYVHLSADIETAQRVASRRKGRNVIIEVHTSTTDQEFYMAENGVWLTSVVPVSALSFPKQTN